MKFYRINVSGTKFFLSQRNIESDSPNLFTEKFRNEPKCTRMAIDKSPDFFALVHLHLQGYNALLDDMDLVEVQNLLSDAKYYRLRKLETLLNARLDALKNQKTSENKFDEESVRKAEEFAEKTVENLIAEFKKHSSYFNEKRSDIEETYETDDDDEDKADAILDHFIQGYRPLLTYPDSDYESESDSESESNFSDISSLCTKSSQSTQSTLDYLNWLVIQKKYD